MPSYDFKNKKTGEIIEVRMSMNDLDKYKEDNPDMELSLIHISDPRDKRQSRMPSSA